MYDLTCSLEWVSSCGSHHHMARNHKSGNKTSSEHCVAELRCLKSFKKLSSIELNFWCALQLKFFRPIMLYCVLQFLFEWVKLAKVSLCERNYRYGLLMRYIDIWARISSRKLLNCTHCIVEFECVSAQLYLVDDSQLQWRENISEKWTKKTSRIVKKCSIHECIFWFVPNPQGKDFDKSNQTSAWNLPNFDQEIQCTERVLFFIH